MKIFNDTQGNVDAYYETAYYGWQNPRQALIGLCDGYKEAADQLVDYVLAAHNNIKIRDQFIFPIIFNYRHSIEILLKLIYMRGENKLCSGGHNLLSIWSAVNQDIINGILCNEEFINHMRTENPKLTPPDVKKLELNKIKEMLRELQKSTRNKKEIKEYSSNDEKADVWRYLISKEGILYFSEEHGIYYPSLKEGIEELFSRLKYLYDVVDQFLSA